MWNKALQLNAARRLEQNNSVALEPALELRPQILDIGSRRADPRTNVGTRSQCETRDLGMTLPRCPTQFSHRTKDDYPLPSGTGSLKQFNGGARRSWIGVVCVVDEGDVTHLFPRHSHLGLRHCRYSFRGVFVAHTAFASDGQRKHGVPQIVEPTNGRSDRDTTDLDDAESAGADLPSVGLQLRCRVQTGHHYPLGLVASSLGNFRLRRRRYSDSHAVVDRGFFAENACEVTKAFEMLLCDRCDKSDVWLHNVAQNCDFARKARSHLPDCHVRIRGQREGGEWHAD